MPPKKPKLHELAVEVASGTTFLDVSKKVQYVMGYQFATGGFGRIYTCKEQGKSNELVVKVEPNTNGPLFTEIHVFQRILKKDMLDNYAKQKKLSSVALPWIVASGTFDYKSEKLRYMIMPKYETSLEAVREHNGGSLSAFDTWNTASTMLNALEYLHHNKYVHADLKAANILLKKKTDMKTAVLVDFGLARMASSNVDKPEKKRAHNGTAIFTSIDAHRGCNPSYRGDIEILAYNALFWISGKLPWQSVEANPDKVFNDKQKFMDNLQDGIAKLVKSSASSTAIKDLFNVALKTKYTEQVDFSDLHNPVDRAISATRNESAVTKKTRTITPKKSTANRTKTVQKKAVAKEETDESEESTGEGSPEKVKPASALVTMRRRLARKRSSTEEEEYEIGSLKENVATEKKPKVGTTPASLQKTSDRLRQNVPGLRNLPKGRRSIVVNQIAKKYHKIAAKKAVDE